MLEELSVLSDEEEAIYRALFLCLQ